MKNALLAAALLAFAAVSMAGCDTTAPEQQANPLVLNTVDMTTPVPDPSIDEDQAVTIAMTDLPQELASAGSFTAVRMTDQWIVRCSFLKRTVSAEDLNWDTNPDAKLLNVGILPEDCYRYLTFDIDALTGEITCRTASDSLADPEDATVGTYNPNCGCD